MEIYGRNTDGFIIKTDVKDISTILNEWCEILKVKLKKDKLASVEVISGQGSKLSLSGKYTNTTSGLNFYKQITPFTSFRFNKPRIVKWLMVKGGKIPSDESLIRTQKQLIICIQLNHIIMVKY